MSYPEEEYRVRRQKLEPWGIPSIKMRVKKEKSINTTEGNTRG